jgi:hypothetical protein
MEWKASVVVVVVFCFCNERDRESNWNVFAVMACSYWKSHAHRTPVTQVWRSVTT